MTRYYKWLAADGPVYGDGEYATPGEWQVPIKGKLVPCRHGYHVFTAEQVSFWCGDGLIEVEAQDIEIRQADKCLCRTWREIRRLAWTEDDMIDYGLACGQREGRRFRVQYDPACSLRCIAREWATQVRDAAYSAAQAASSGIEGIRAERKWQRKWIERRIGEPLG